MIVVIFPKNVLQFKKSGINFFTSKEYTIHIRHFKDKKGNCYHTLFHDKRYLYLQGQFSTSFLMCILQVPSSNSLYDLPIFLKDLLDIFEKGYVAILSMTMQSCQVYVTIRHIYLRYAYVLCITFSIFNLNLKKRWCDVHLYGSKLCVYICINQI